MYSAPYQGMSQQQNYNQGYQGQQQVPINTPYNNHLMQLEQTQRQINDKLDWLKQASNNNHQQQGQNQIAMQFLCFPIANIEELKATPLNNPNMPIIGTSLMNDVIFVKNPDGSIEIFKKHIENDSKEESVSEPVSLEVKEEKESYVTLSEYKKLKSEFEKIKKILGGMNNVEQSNATSDDGNAQKESDVQPSNANSKSNTGTSGRTAKK